MTKITAAEVNKLRKQTGAGMMDCKKALVEAEGDFDAAIDILRKKGQKVAAKRADREATEGAVIAKVNADATTAVLVSLNCETDFVAMNEDFVKLATDLLDLAITSMPADMAAFKALNFDGMSVEEKLVEQTGVIGEKIEIGAYEKIDAAFTSAYIHAGSKLASLVGLTARPNNAEEIGKDVAMQVAAMNPLGLGKDDIAEDVIARELEVAKDQARQEGKPEAMLDKIANGRLNKFYKENTLLEQMFIKDNKKSISQYLNENEKGMTVSSFKRFGLGV